MKKYIKMWNTHTSGTSDPLRPNCFPYFFLLHLMIHNDLSAACL